MASMLVFNGNDTVTAIYSVQNHKLTGCYVAWQHCFLGECPSNPDNGHGTALLH